MHSLTTKATVGLALLGALILAATTLAVLGFGIPAAAAAARNTARFSGLLLAMALAWPALGEAARRFAGVSTLLAAFVAAHVVHYAAVVNLAVLDPSHHLHELRPAALGVASFGTLLLLTIALSNGAQGGWKRGLNRVTVVVAWLLFVIAFGSRVRMRALDAAMLVIMLVAIALRARAALGNRAKAVSNSP